MRLASFTSRFLEHSLWGKPTTRLEDQLLRLSHCEEVASGYFESLHGERWPARARHSSHIKAGARHVSRGKKQKPKPSQMWRRTKGHSRTEASKCPIQAIQSTGPLGRGPSSRGGWRVRGAAPAVAAWLPDPWDCVHQKMISIFLTTFWGQCVRSSGLPEMGNPLGLAVWFVFYKHTRTYFSKY